MEHSDVNAFPITKKQLKTISQDNYYFLQVLQNLKRNILQKYNYMDLNHNWKSKICLTSKMASASSYRRLIHHDS